MEKSRLRRLPIHCEWWLAEDLCYSQEGGGMDYSQEHMLNLCRHSASSVEKRFIALFPWNSKKWDNEAWVYICVCIHIYILYIYIHVHACIYVCIVWSRPFWHLGHKAPSPLLHCHAAILEANKSCFSIIYLHSWARLVINIEASVSA